MGALTYQLFISVVVQSRTKRRIIFDSAVNLFGIQFHVFQEKNSAAIQNLLQDDGEAVDVSL